MFDILLGIEVMGASDMGVMEGRMRSRLCWQRLSFESVLQDRGDALVTEGVEGKGPTAGSLHPFNTVLFA